MTVEASGEVEKIRLFWKWLDASTLVWRDKVRHDGKGEPIAAVWRRKFGEPMGAEIGRYEIGSFAALVFPKGRVLVHEPHQISIHVLPTSDNPATMLEAGLTALKQRFLKPKW